ncbi:hypothetical protein [Erythrobacter sp. HKB08]|uniref:hypothetical protein n=1 Tax=Erythrobacter sp. HKB08 TaxID=2502843 RepID=UPI0010087C33|nr:hypothetical protein [Erythrobacter sp. HKB08]
MTHYRYRHSGCLVGSQIELPEWEAFAVEGKSEPAEVSIELGTVETAELERADADHVAFEVQGTGRWAISAGNRILIDAEKAAQPEESRLFTLGSAWGALGYQRGWAMWHASGVAIGGKAALFCGDSAQGKSTMAGALVSRSHRLVADDLSRVSIEDAAIFPSASRLKLWDVALEQFGWSSGDLQRDHFLDARFHKPVADAMPPDSPIGIGAIFVLQWGDAVNLERLRGSEAVTELSAATIYRREFLEPMGRLTEHVVGCTKLAGRVPVYRLTRPLDFAHIDSVCEAIEEVMQK